MSKIQYVKPFLSVADQMSLLKSRGLHFTDEVGAKQLLKYIGYYRFSGYWYPLLADKRNHVFKFGAQFDTAYELYKFDQELRKLLLSAMEPIEVAVRAQMTEVMSTAHGTFWMDDMALFADATKYHATLAKIFSEMHRSDEEFILAFVTKYSNPLPPSFVTLEIASFGVLSRLYENLKSGRDKRSIAQTFGLADRVFASWLHSFVYIRNVCAHHSRLWNKLLQIQPLFPKKPMQQWLSNRMVCNDHIYYVLSMVVYLLNTICHTHTFRQNLKSLLTQYPNVDVRAMGFPDDWEKEHLWQE